MRLTRRAFLKGTAGALLLSAAPSLPGAPEEKRYVPDYQKPLFDLHQYVNDPVRIKSIELLKNGGRYFVRSRSADGTVGIARTKQVRNYVPIFENRVAPHFIGCDARDLENLIDRVYVKNYKIAGQPFWCPVAYVEESLFDLLGKISGKSVGELMGGVKRKEIPVYLSGSRRSTSPEEEVAVYERGVEKTGAEAVKIKIGGRMNRNVDVYPGRTEELIKRARKRLGDDVVLYADANGGYNAEKAVEVGRRLEALNFQFFEEPCPWEEKGQTAKVAEELDMPVAFGEVDSSLWMFQWMIKNRHLDIVQPDINYNGGFIRTARVARMAEKAGLPIVPHSTQTGPGAANMLQFASAVSNIGPYMEFPWRHPRKESSWYTPDFKIRDGSIRVPDGPGLGVSYDPSFLEQARVVARVD